LFADWLSTIDEIAHTSSTTKEDCGGLVSTKFTAEKTATPCGKSEINVVLLHTW
jgi:hypothetical protein